MRVGEERWEGGSEGWGGELGGREEKWEGGEVLWNRELKLLKNGNT